MSEVPLWFEWTLSDATTCSSSSYRGCSKLRTRTVLGSYGRAMLRGIGPP